MSHISPSPSSSSFNALINAANSNASAVGRQLRDLRQLLEVDADLASSSSNLPLILHSLEELNHQLSLVGDYEQLLMIASSNSNLGNRSRRRAWIEFADCLGVFVLGWDSSSAQNQVNKNSDVPVFSQCLIPVEDPECQLLAMRCLSNVLDLMLSYMKESDSDRRKRLNIAHNSELQNLNKILGFEDFLNSRNFFKFLEGFKLKIPAEVASLVKPDDNDESFECWYLDCLLSQNLNHHQKNAPSTFSTFGSYYIPINHINPTIPFIQFLCSSFLLRLEFIDLVEACVGLVSKVTKILLFETVHKIETDRNPASFDLAYSLIIKNDQLITLATDYADFFSLNVQKMIFEIITWSVSRLRKWKLYVDGDVMRSEISSCVTSRLLVVFYNLMRNNSLVDEKSLAWVGLNGLDECFAWLIGDKSNLDHSLEKSVENLKESSYAEDTIQHCYDTLVEVLKDSLAENVNSDEFTSNIATSPITAVNAAKMTSSARNSNFSTILSCLSKAMTLLRHIKSINKESPLEEDRPVSASVDSEDLVLKLLLGNETENYDTDILIKRSYHEWTALIKLGLAVFDYSGEKTRWAPGSIMERVLITCLKIHKNAGWMLTDAEYISKNEGGVLGTLYGLRVLIFRLLSGISSPTHDEEMQNQDSKHLLELVPYLVEFCTSVLCDVIEELKNWQKEVQNFNIQPLSEPSDGKNGPELYKFESPAPPQLHTFFLLIGSIGEIGNFHNTKCDGKSINDCFLELFGRCGGLSLLDQLLGFIKKILLVEITGLCDSNPSEQTVNDDIIFKAAIDLGYEVLNKRKSLENPQIRRSSRLAASNKSSPESRTEGGNSKHKDIENESNVRFMLNSASSEVMKRFVFWSLSIFSSSLVSFRGLLNMHMLEISDKRAFKDEKSKEVRWVSLQDISDGLLSPEENQWKDAVCSFHSLLKSDLGEMNPSFGLTPHEFIESGLAASLFNFFGRFEKHCLSNKDIREHLLYFSDLFLQHDGFTNLPDDAPILKLLRGLLSYVEKFPASWPITSPYIFGKVSTGLFSMYQSKSRLKKSVNMIGKSIRIRLEPSADVTENTQRAVKEYNLSESSADTADDPSVKNIFAEIDANVQCIADISSLKKFLNNRLNSSLAKLEKILGIPAQKIDNSTEIKSNRVDESENMEEVHEDKIPLSESDFDEEMEEDDYDDKDEFDGGDIIQHAVDEEQNQRLRPESSVVHDINLNSSVAGSSGQNTEKSTTHKTLWDLELSIGGMRINENMSIYGVIHRVESVIKRSTELGLDLDFDSSMIKSERSTIFSEIGRRLFGISAVNSLNPDSLDVFRNSYKIKYRPIFKDIGKVEDFSKKSLIQNSFSVDKGLKSPLEFENFCDSTRIPFEDSKSDTDAFFSGNSLRFNYPAYDVSFDAESSESYNKDNGYLLALELLRIIYILNEETNWLSTLRFANYSETYVDESQKPKIPKKSFRSPKIASYIQKQLADVFAVSSGILPRWTWLLNYKFGFLFSLEERLDYLQSARFGTERSLMKWRQKFSAKVFDNITSRQLEFGRISRQNVRVSRDNIFESAIKVLNTYAKNNKYLMEVEFFGEVGSGLGPTLEFYALVSQEFRNKNLNIWRAEKTVEIGENQYVLSSNGLFPMPLMNSLSRNSADKSMSTEKFEKKSAMSIFEALGTFLAKSLVDFRIVDIPLNPIFILRAVFDEPLGESPKEIRFSEDSKENLSLYYFLISEIKKLEIVDEHLGQSLRDIAEFCRLKMPVLEDRSLTDEEKREMLNQIRHTKHGASLDDISLDWSLPGYPSFILSPSSNNANVDIFSVEEYLFKVIDATIYHGIEEQLSSFRYGFSQIFPIESLRCFGIGELQYLFSSPPWSGHWNYDELMRFIKVDHGYTPQSDQFKWLLEIMCSFNEIEQRKFLQFVTGSPKLPIGGFKSLSPPLTVVAKSIGEERGTSSRNNSVVDPTIDRESSKSELDSIGESDLDLIKRLDDQYYPSVMTCANYLKIPRYSSKEALKWRLQEAIIEGQGSFHLS